MVDVARKVVSCTTIDRPVLVEFEEVARLQGVSMGSRDALSGIFNDATSRSQRSRGEKTATKSGPRTSNYDLFT